MALRTFLLVHPAGGLWTVSAKQGGEIQKFVRYTL